MPGRFKRELPPLKLKHSIGKRLATTRKNQGLTQSILAKKIGITQTLVSDYETGRLHLSDEMIIRFALALGVSSDEILGLVKIQRTTGSLKLMRRVQQIENMAPSDQKALLRTIDKYIQNL